MEIKINNEEDELYQIMKIKMNTEEEQLFLISHYLYLEYGNDNTKFVIDFDNVWKWVGFSRKDHAKRVLDKNFTIDTDYKVEKSAPQLGGKFLEPINGGQNKEKITLLII